MELQVGRNSLNQNIEYTQASINDLNLLSDLISEFRKEFDGMLFSEEDLIACPQSPGNPLCHLRDSLMNPDSFVAVAKANTKAIAFLKFDRGHTSKSRHRGVFTMAVRESFWGNGVGRSLLVALEKWAHPVGIKRLELNVLESNERAMNLYIKAGYQIEGHKQYAALVKGEFVGGYWMAKIL